MPKPVTKLYNTTDNENFTLTTISPQCPCKVTLGGQCQGVAGHEGDHWWFHPNGNYHFTTDESFSGQTPPNHVHYRTPKSMMCYRYSLYARVEDVTDPEEILRLKRGRLNPGESLTRPVTITAEQAEMTGPHNEE